MKLNIKKYYTLVLVLLFSYQAYCQIDSLENELIAMPNDSLKVEALLDMVKQMKRERNRDKANDFQQRACKLSEEVGYKKGNISCYNFQGITARNQGNYGEALEHHEQALALSRHINNRFLISVSLNNMGTVYRRLDNYEKALECHLESLEIAKLMRNQKGIAVSLNSIGNIYLVRKDYDKALETFEECIKIESRQNNKLGVAINLNNIGYIYDGKGELEKALNYYQRSLAMNQEILSKKGLSISYNDIGRIKFKMNQAKSALDYYHKALDINLKNNYKKYAIDNYINIGKVHALNKNGQLAISQWQKGLTLAKEIGTLAQASECLQLMADVEENNGNASSALNYYKESSLYLDSLAKTENEKSVSQLLARFETKNKELQIQELKSIKEIQEAKIKNRQITIIALVGAVILVLTLLGVLFRNYQHKMKTNKLLTDQKSEIEIQKSKIEKKNKALESKNKDLIDLNLEKNNVLGIIAHDLRSPMNHIIGLTSIMSYEKATLNDDQVQSLEMISDTSVRMREMINRILDINAMDAKELSLELEEVNVSNCLQNVIKEFLDPANKKNIQINTEIDQHIKALLDKNYTIQILENLIANAIKFNPKDKSIFIRLLHHNENIRIEIEDEGMGIKKTEQSKLFRKFQILSSKPTAGEKSTGLGLYIVKTFVEAMSGQVWCESSEGNGAKFIVEFKAIS